MPADNTLPEITDRHGDGDAPYPCHKWPKAPGADWALNHGYCRHSLDTMCGVHDPRCPADCPHKAPAAVAKTFEKRLHWLGAQAAAEWAQEQRHESDR